MIALYVNDFLIDGNSKTPIDRINEKFKVRYRLKDVGEAYEVLKIETTCNISNRTIFRAQNGTLKKNFNELENQTVVQCAHRSNPRLDTISLSSLDYAFDAPYRDVVQNISYLMAVARLDLAYTIRKSSQHLKNPLQSHWIAAQ